MAALMGCLTLGGVLLESIIFLYNIIILLDSIIFLYEIILENEETKYLPSYYKYLLGRDTIQFNQLNLLI